MLPGNTRQLVLGVVAVVIAMSPSLASHADQMGYGRKTNINLAVASNFYGVPPSNSAITDIINAFESANPNYTVTVTDNGATSTLESHIINGNQYKVDLFLAADTETPLDLLTNYFDLVTPYNNSYRPPLYTFNYAQGVLAFLGNGVDVTCATGSCGYNTSYSSVAIADPSLAPYGVAAQSVLIGRYGLQPPLSSNHLVVEYPNITAAFEAVIGTPGSVGFVAMSAICLNGSFPTTGDETTAIPYFTSETSAQNPSVVINNYNPLTQAGISIRNRRTPGSE
jgi:ABC-type molybdate transport system substrate-binding protein